MNDRGVVTLSGSGEVLAPDRLPAAPWAPFSKVNSDVSVGLQSAAAQEVHAAWEQVKQREAHHAAIVREYRDLAEQNRERNEGTHATIAAEARGEATREEVMDAVEGQLRLEAERHPLIRQRRENAAEREVTEALHRVEQLVNENARELMGELLPLAEKVAGEYQKKHEKFLKEVESAQREWNRMRDAAMQILGRTKPIRAEDFPADGKYGTPPVPANLRELLNPEPAEVAA